MAHEVMNIYISMVLHEVMNIYIYIDGVARGGEYINPWCSRWLNIYPWCSRYGLGVGGGTGVWGERGDLLEICERFFFSIFIMMTIKRK